MRNPPLETIAPLAEALDARESDAHFLSDLVASLPGAAYRVRAEPDGGWRYTYLSPGIEALFGIGAREVLARRSVLTACIVPEDREAHRNAVRHAARTLEPLDHEYRIRSRAGTTRWLHVRAVARPGPQGTVLWTGIVTDVSVRKAVEQSLRASEERFRTLFETVPQGIVYQARTGAITSANAAAERILGLSLDQMQGRTSMDPEWRAVREDGSPFPGDQHPAMVALRTGAPVRDVVMGVHSPGRGLVWILVNAVPLFRDGQLDHVYASFEDITERTRLAQELEREASTDCLTGVANRRCFMRRAEVERLRIARDPGAVTALALLDIDRFKLVNDTHGHAAGDAVLLHVVRTIGEEIGPADLLGRTGGEEFALLLVGRDLAGGADVAERIRARLAGSPASAGARSVPVTVSVGVSALAPADRAVDVAFARADRALYEAKAAGRNTVRTHGGLRA